MHLWMMLYNISSVSSEALTVTGVSKYSSALTGSQFNGGFKYIGGPYHLGSDRHRRYLRLLLVTKTKFSINNTLNEVNYVVYSL